MTRCFDYFCIITFHVNGATTSPAGARNELIRKCEFSVDKSFSALLDVEIALLIMWSVARESIKDEWC